MALPRPLRAFLLLGALCAALCLGSEAVCRFLLHWGAPYDSPTIHTPLRFVDFHAFFNKFAFFHTPAFFDRRLGVLPYPAPALVAYKAFLIPQPTPFHGTGAIARFEGSLLLASWIALALLYRSLVRRGLSRVSAAVFVVGLYLLSYPFWLEFLQGNIEWVVWVFLMGGLWAFCRRHQYTAAVCIGIAASLKLFPIVFVGLFLSFRQFRAALLAVAAAVASTVASLWLICPDIRLSATQTLRSLGLFEHSYLVKVRPVEVGYDHSLFALIKLGLTAVAGATHLQARMGLYLALAALGGCVLYVLRIRHLPLTNQVLCLTVAAVLLPPISYDYTLIHLYAALALLAFVAIERGSRGEETRLPGLWAALLLLAFALSFQSEFIVRGHLFAGQLKCVALLALGWVSLRYPFAGAGVPVEQARMSPPTPRLQPVR